MICRCCHNFFKVERSFLELFKNKIVYLCPSCKRKHPLVFKSLELPLDNLHVLRVYYLYDEMFSYEREAFSYEYGLVTTNLLKRKLNFIFNDTFKESELYLYNMLAKMLDKDIYLLVYNLNG